MVFITLWYKRRYMIYKGLYVVILCITQARRNRGGWGGCSPPRFLLNSIFSELKEIVLIKWKIVQNYKASWSSSKFLYIYNIIIELNTRDDILYPVSNELREILLFLIFHSL